MSNSFTPTYKELKIDNINYEIQLWDTAGQEKYRSISKIFFKDSHIIIFVYEILSPKSFSELAFWTDYVKEYSPEIVVLGVAANKTDLLTQVHKSEDLVSKEEGVQENGIHDTVAEPGDLEPVPEQVFLIINAVVGDQFLLPLPLMHFKGVIDAMELNNFAPCIKKVGEAVIPGAELLFQLYNTLGGINGLSELRLKKIA